MPLGAGCFLPQGQRGGVRHDPANGCGNSLFPDLLCFQ